MINVTSVRKIFLDKKRGQVTALDNVSLNFLDGKITALLGMNGAGKSTLIRLIQGTLSADAGNIEVSGKNVKTHLFDVRRSLGVLADDVGLYKKLTARENIEYFAELQGLSGKEAKASAQWFIDHLNMHSIADRLTHGFSQGERMKTALARALVHRPKNILLDEPLNGLDVLTSRDVKHLLRELAASGHCIVVSSHQMLEIEQLCDEVVVIDKGQVKFSGSLQQAREEFAMQSLEDIFVHLLTEEVSRVEG